MEAVLQKQKVSRRKKAVKIVVAAVVVLLVISAVLFGIANAYIARSLPQIEGELSVAGLAESVTVARDEHGVPHIYASNEHDLFMAQGYVTAQDRLFQMDLSRRQASGELSEVIGEKAVDRDKYFRTLGLRRAAKLSHEVYSQEAKDILQWYADGVNAYISEAKAKGALPIEFALLGYEPKEWTPFDSLTIGKYMAYDLGGHWEGQAFRYYLLNHFPKEKAYDLFPNEEKAGPPIIPPIGDGKVDVEKSFAKAIIPPEFNGSNNWVVSGKKSASGKPLLADDPHLSLATPSIWYQTHLKAPSVNVSGVIFAGVPGIILGHNEHVAWGVTNTGPDVQDLYIEKRNPEQPSQFLYMGKWEEAQVIDEPIRVKDKETIPYQVTITRHGPVISEFAEDSGKDTVFSLKWTALEPSRELEAVLRMNKAKNWNEFEKALEDFHTPTQNFVFAAQDGTIAYKANGKIPIRKKGNSLVPVPGWTDEYEWTGYIPYDQLPKTVNPKQGFISSANYKVTDDSYPYHISNVWAQPYRQMRIQQVLQAKEKLTVEDMQKLQMDQANLQADEFVPIFLEHVKKEPLTEKEKAVLAVLETWNFVDDKDLAAPLVFHTWMRQVANVLFKEQIPDSMNDLFEGKRQIVDDLIRRAHTGKPGPWVQEKGGLSKVLHAALQEAIAEIEAAHGTNSEKWKWGEAHQMSFLHPLSSVTGLNYLFNWAKPIPAGGSAVTVQAASYNQKTGLINHGASWRFVVDTNDLTKGYHVVGPGQSGHVKSPWYDDQFGAWVEGVYHATSITEAKETGHVLTLRPK
ncbi:penicillin acylase family protein [Brevibacillus borstelensis]|uniref:penicillin acylase family protein n=1 Tax=Brevibacillus borstelensis TaxID=45462 RepID=UPI003CE49AA7